MTDRRLENLARRIDAARARHGFTPAELVRRRHQWATIRMIERFGHASLDVAKAGIAMRDLGQAVHAIAQRRATLIDFSHGMAR